MSTVAYLTLTYGKELFKEYSKSILYIFTYFRYDKEAYLWKAESLKFPDFLATSLAMESSLLLGLQEWTVYNDSCTKEGSYTLMMTGCTEDDFTCNDATCVSMSVRYDGHQ